MFVFTDSEHLTHWIFVYFLATVKSLLIVCWPSWVLLPQNLCRKPTTECFSQFFKDSSPLKLEYSARILYYENISSCCSSVAKSYPTFYDPVDCSTSGFHVFQYSQGLLKLMSIELMMPSNHFIFLCLLLLPSIFPSIRVFSNKLSLHIRWPMYWSFSISISPSDNIQDWFPLGLTGLISLLSKGLSRVFSSTTVWKHQFFSAQSSLWSNSHVHTWLLEKW